MCYEDFCEVLERAVEDHEDIRDGMSPPPRRTIGRTLGRTGSTDDLLFSRREDDRLNLKKSFHSERKPPRPSVQESFSEFDDDDEVLLLPPKRLDSTGFSRYAESPRDSRTTLLGNSMKSSSPILSRSLETPRSPPRKVGAAMWGRDTPLGKKGLPPKGGDGKWCCAVCYYTENSPDSAVCEVCTSPNHHANKEFSLKVQCPNCTFMNGQFALACEMCGKALGKK